MPGTRTGPVICDRAALVAVGHGSGGSMSLCPASCSRYRPGCAVAECRAPSESAPGAVRAGRGWAVCTEGDAWHARMDAAPVPGVLCQLATCCRLPGQRACAQAAALDTAPPCAPPGAGAPHGACRGVHRPRVVQDPGGPRSHPRWPLGEGPGRRLRGQGLQGHGWAGREGAGTGWKLAWRPPSWTGV